MADSKTCPACESKVGDDDLICSQCGTVLSIFDAEFNTIGLPGKECESHLSEIMEKIEYTDETGGEDVIERVRTIGRIVPVIIEQFTCPSCGEMLPATANSCSRCGAQFIEEGVSQFQCPICKVMVDATATRCPGCGAEFAEEKKEVDEKEPAEIEKDKEKEKDASEERAKEPVIEPIGGMEKDTTKSSRKGEDEKKEKKKKSEHSWTRFIKRKK